MSENMIERVARALALCAGGKMSGPGQSVATREFAWEGDGGHLDRYIEKHWQEHVNAAQFAIEAMRELPEEPGPRYTSGEYSRRTQKAMVDDALGVQSSP